MAGLYPIRNTERRSASIPVSELCRCRIRFDRFFSSKTGDCLRKLNLSRMELRHLKYFLTVAEERHFNRAAARLRISQPAISRQIKDLEHELGVELLTRDGHQVGLTPAGETFLAHARDLIKRASRACEDMRPFRRSSGERLSIGFITPVMTSTLMPALPHFKKQHPDVEIEFLELSPQAQIESLRARRIDLGFIGSTCEKLQTEFEVSVVKKIALAAVLPGNHPLASRKRIMLAELSSDVFVGFSENTQPGRFDTMCHICQKAGFTPSIRYHADSLAAALALIGIDKGVSLMPEEISRLPHPNVVFIKLRGPVPRLLSMAAYRKSDENRMIADLIKHCQCIS